MFQAVDVTDDQAVSDWAESVLSEMGAPDLLINNAAVINRNRFLWDLGAAEFDEVIDINIKGVTNVIRHFFKPIWRRPGAAIVNFSSGWGRSTSPEVAPYCATKWAIEGLTQSLAQNCQKEWRRCHQPRGDQYGYVAQLFLGLPQRILFPPRNGRKMAVPFLLELGPGHNGQSLTVKASFDLFTACELLASWKWQIRHGKKIPPKP